MESGRDAEICEYMRSNENYQEGKLKHNCPTQWSIC